MAAIWRSRLPHWHARHRRRLRRVSGTAAVVSCGALLVAACSSSSPGSSAASGGAQTLPTVTMSYAAPVAEFMIPVVGARYGLFKKYGINLQTKYLPQTESLDSLVSGATQFGLFDAPAPETASASGQAINWIAAYQLNPGLQYIVAPGVNTLAGLAGKSVTITVAGASTAILTQLALTQAGVYSKVHVVPVGNVAAQMSSFEAGTSSGFVSGQPVTDEVLSKVPGSKVIDTFSNVQWIGAGAAVVSSWASSHKAEVLDFLRGLQASATYFKTHPANAEKVIEQETNATPSMAAIAYHAELGILLNKLVLPTQNLSYINGILNQQHFTGASSLTSQNTALSSYLDSLNN